MTATSGVQAMIIDRQERSAARSWPNLKTKP